MLFVFANDFGCAYNDFDDSIKRPKGHFRLAGAHLEFVPPEFPFHYRLTGPSTLMAFADQALRRAGWWEGRKHPSATSPDQRLEIFRLLLAEIQRSSRRAGADFVLVYLPDKKDSRPPAYQELLRQFSDQAGVQYLDLTGLLNTDLNRYFRRDLHINESGHQFVAEMVWNQILRARLEAFRSAGVLPSPGGQTRN
jgi:hypothetical protein